MTTLAELIAQKEALEAQIQQLRSEERSKALEEVRAFIRDFDFTPDDLFSAGRRASAAPRTQGVPKYRDPESGKTWTGKGRVPAWLEGKNKDDFKI